MTPSRSQPRSIRRLALACGLALLAAGLVAPSTARASHCGRYVLRSAAFQRDLASLLDPGAEATAPTPARPPGPPPRCTGAFCSGQPATPIVPTVLPADVVERWLCASDFAAIPRPIASPIATEERAARPIDRQTPVFHPPRRRGPSA